MPKFIPGDVVLVRDTGPLYLPKTIQGVIAFEKKPEPCSWCKHAACHEWSNILLETGEWLYHVPECQMELSEFGQCLRNEA
ncbi:MAG TPA: hypothetical protein VGK74_25560 [Symbiobacteriaceae bacterium]